MARCIRPDRLVELGPSLPPAARRGPATWRSKRLPSGPTKIGPESLLPMPTSRCASRGRIATQLLPDIAAKELRAEAKAGRMDGDVVESVLGAAGHRVARRREGPAGLTAREVDVLRLVARGLSNKQMGARLVISPKTARNHIEHIYTKIGVSNRAGAGLFAMQHGLLPDEEPAAS